MTTGMAADMTYCDTDVCYRPTIERFFQTIEIVIDTPLLLICRIGSIFIAGISGVG
jgi:hypothetical protein